MKKSFDEQKPGGIYEKSLNEYEFREMVKNFFRKRMGLLVKKITKILKQRNEKNKMTCV